MAYTDYNKSIIMGTQDSGEVLVEGVMLRYTLKGRVEDALFLRLKNVGEGAIEDKIVDRVLIDMSNVERFSMVARNALSEFLRKQNTVKIAIFGGNQFIKTTISFIVTAIGSSCVRLTQNEKEAVQWLAS